MTPLPPTTLTDAKRLAMERALLRERLADHARSLSDIELRYLVQELGLAAEDDPVVTKYPGERYKLSTDPEEMPPYPRPMTQEESDAEIELARQQFREGKTVPAEEVLALLRSYRL